MRKTFMQITKTLILVTNTTLIIKTLYQNVHRM